MRATIELPDDLYRGLKARASLSGVTLRELVQQLIERGLRSPAEVPDTGTGHAPPPVVVPPRGVPIPALSREVLRSIEEEEDEGKHARFA